ncbi:MAG: 4Fe-4S dicluster domain-containing protein [Elusimicrobia bacterium]|nr:4Fe-4S dicluster domain-containing protein [Elusimicrobiota bacterium]
MRSYKSLRKITEISTVFQERGQPPIDEYGKVRSEYYSFRRSELKEAIISAGIFTEEDIQSVESEGCHIVVANALCISPFSGFRYYLLKRFPDEILTGLKILMVAVASYEGEIVAPRNDAAANETLRKAVALAPNVSIRFARDRYPLGIDALLFDRYYNQNKKTRLYHHGKDGIFIVPIEKLLDVYISLEVDVSEKSYPIFTVQNDERLLTWVKQGNRGKLSKKLLDQSKMLVRRSLLCGSLVSKPSNLDLKATEVFFLSDKSTLKAQECIGCGICRAECTGFGISNPRSVIRLTSSKGLVLSENLSGCIDCGLCTYFCPGFRK